MAMRCGHARSCRGPNPPLGKDRGYHPRLLWKAHPDDSPHDPAAALRDALGFAPALHQVTDRMHRAARRGHWKVTIQSYLTAAAINLIRLAKALGYLRAWIERRADRLAEPGAPHNRFERLILHPSIHRLRGCPLAA